MTAASPRRRARPPIVLVVLLLAAIGGALFLVSRDPSTAFFGHDEVDTGAVATEDDVTSPRSGPDNAAAGLSPSGADSVVLRGAEPGVADGTTTDEDPEALDRLAAEAEAQRRVFDGSIGGERPPLLGTRWRGRSGASGSVGIGNAPQLTGRVTDAVTGDPIAGAEVLSVLAKEDGWARRYTSVTTAEDGTFQARVPLRHAEQSEFLVRAPGYRQQRAARADAPEEWRLVPYEGRDRGTIRGSAVSPEGVALAGMLLVAMKSEHGDEEDQYAWCDASGTFELPGVRPGRWRLSLEDDQVVETTVVAGGLATAKLIAARPDARPPETPGADRRIVEITGLPDGTTLRADAGPGVFGRAVVDGGVARFDLPFGLWILTVDEKDGGVQPITVREEHGARRIEFVPDRE